MLVCVWVCLCDYEMVIVTSTIPSPPPPPPCTATPSQAVQLMGVDLLRQQKRWKDSLMEIRQTMASLVQVIPFACQELDNPCLAVCVNQTMIH